MSIAWQHDLISLHAASGHMTVVAASVAVGPITIVAVAVAAMGISDISHRHTQCRSRAGAIFA